MSKSSGEMDPQHYVEQVANHRGWQLNPDRSLTETILHGLAQNSQLRGKPYCPCRDSAPDATQDADIICPCRYAADDIKAFGQCYCGLFLAIGKDYQEVTSIPERRVDQD